MGDKFPNKLTTSSQLISMGTVTAQKNLTPPHTWEPQVQVTIKRIIGIYHPR